MRRITKSLSEMDSRESKHISKELDEKRSELQSVNEELASTIEKAEDAAKLLDRIKMHYASWLNKLYKASTTNEEVLVKFIEDYRKR